MKIYTFKNSVGKVQNASVFVQEVLVWKDVSGNLHQSFPVFAFVFSMDSWFEVHENELNRLVDEGAIFCRSYEEASKLM
jgi:hypothetical protein